jgi:hypothetical protein
MRTYGHNATMRFKNDTLKSWLDGRPFSHQNEASGYVG